MKAFFKSTIIFICLATLLSSQSTSGLSSADVKNRMQAFYALVTKQPLSDSEKTEVFSLLETENAYALQLGAADSEVSDDYGVYYSDVVTLVSSLNDSRSLPGLIGAIATGNMVSSTIAGLGSPALPILFPRFKTADVIERFAIIITIDKIIDPARISKVSDAVSRAYIRTLLVSAILDPDSDVQSSAEQAKQSFEQHDVVGDLNDDGKVDCADIGIVKTSFGKTMNQVGFDPRADLNLDGVIDIRDLAIVSQHLPGGTHCQ